MTNFITVAALVYVVLVATLYVFQRNMMYFPDTSVPSPVHSGVPEMQPVTLETEDGLKLLAWYRAVEGQPVVVYFHGNAGNIGARGFKVRPYLDAGFGVLLVSYRGYGGNPGSPTEEGLYADGRAALERGEYELGLHGIGRYLNRFGKDASDAEDWYLYGRARRRVEMPRGKHLREAIRAMRRSLSFDANRVEAREELLELYVESGFGGEALETANLLLEDDPGNVAHHELKVQLLAALGEYDDSLAAAEALTLLRQILPLAVGQQFEVSEHQLVRDAHDPPVDLLGRIRDPDRVPQALGHLVAPVGPHEQGVRDHGLGRMHQATLRRGHRRGWHNRLCRSDRGDHRVGVGFSRASSVLAWKCSQ